MNIKFRGKRIDNGEWVSGDLIHEPWGVVIQHMVPVDVIGPGGPERVFYTKRARTKIDPATVELLEED
jgi:hypothetical protein